MNATSAPRYLLTDRSPDEPLREAIHAAWEADEVTLVQSLLAEAAVDEATSERIDHRAQDLVRRVRARKAEQGPLEAFMQQYDLSSEEGVVLMCLAEALLRIPDDETAEMLIADKLGEADWSSHLGESRSVLVNASTWGLMLTGRLMRLGDDTARDFGGVIRRLVNRSGEPVVRTALRRAMRIMGFQYVMGRTIDEAMERAQKKGNRAYRYTYDMLGEAALTEPDARRYHAAYEGGIRAIGRQRQGDDIFAAPSVSVKLSALHPRYAYTQRERVMKELVPRVLELARIAREQDIALTVDAEEADRLQLSLDVFSAVLADRSLAGWDGFGLAVQAYLRQAPAVIQWLAQLARDSGHRIPVRLVKGAYWDSEVKHAQVEGYPDYPVYTRKVHTDLGYLVCVRRLLADRQAFYPQFATHNAHTIATIAELAGDRLDYEFQRLHGMGEDLYGEVLTTGGYHPACRVYAPVGSHEDLLPYLVRRLLENGANTSFVNRIVDQDLPVEAVAENPLERIRSGTITPHPRIPLPVHLFGETRRNSRGVNLADERQQARLIEAVDPFMEQRWHAAPTGVADDAGRAVHEPAHPDRQVGTVRDATAEEVEQAIAIADEQAVGWDRTPVDQRAAMLERTADALEEHLPEFLALCAREGGKTVHDAVAEVREAVDFCRYYAVQGRRLFGQPTPLAGPTGERNELRLHGRGPFACISPWNFPLAIFTGQVAAALVSGNPVLAKPAEQTPLIAARAVELFHQAGVPAEVLQLLPGDGAIVGARLTADPRLAGVAFTGSTETARVIAQTLAARDAPLASLVAETGGQNAMLVDSSALPEQVVEDVIGSAFISAGQRCSALRVLFVQSDIADRVIEMLAGAMKELVVGDPCWLSTDVGPVIDAAALAMLEDHAAKMERDATPLAQVPLGDDLAGHFFAPRAFEIGAIGELEREVFGPILHVVRFRARDLDEVIDSINATGYGLTLGVHSRIDRVQRYVAHRVRVGNAYVNRTMTGAVVGVQPFGGEGLSGTGPKAGGPHYLLPFATERTLTVNTAAVGGNASLLALDE